MIPLSRGASLVGDAVLGHTCSGERRRRMCAPFKATCKGDSEGSLHGAASGQLKMGFQQVCGFITQLAEQQVNVIATASEVPKIKMKMVQQVAMGLGCSNFFSRSFHPETCYDILGVSDECSEEEIRAGYLAKAKELHPDMNPGVDVVDAMSRVTEAHEILSDPELRALYDNGVADLVLNSHEEDVFSSVISKSM